MTTTNVKQIIVEAVKDVPVASVAAAKFAGLTLDSWVWIIGSMYIIGRTVWFGVECYWKWKDRRDGKGK
jgi:uncharacterized membrane protein